MRTCWSAPLPVQYALGIPWSDQVAQMCCLQGKTDVALLTILRCLSTLTTGPLRGNEKPSLPPASQYKIIYVAPLKALAAEITAKFAKRLGWAGVKVRELTGDMKLTRKEVDETGVIVTTPEKWDVVTRRGAGSGDGEVAEVSGVRIHGRIRR